MRTNKLRTLSSGANSVSLVSGGAIISTVAATVGAVLFVTCGIPAMLNAELAKR